MLRSISFFSLLMKHPRAKFPFSPISASKKDGFIHQEPWSWFNSTVLYSNCPFIVIIELLVRYVNPAFLAASKSEFYLVISALGADVNLLLVHNTSALDRFSRLLHAWGVPGTSIWFKYKIVVVG